MTNEHNKPVGSDQPVDQALDLPVDRPGADHPDRADERDLLVSRVVDGVAGAGDWSRLDALARADSGLWRELALAQRDAACLNLAVEDQIAGADTVNVPVREHMVLRLSQRSRLVATWAGWAAAAVVALAWIGVPVASSPQDPASPTQSAGLFTTAADALDAYLRKGQADGNVVRQMPSKVLVDARELPDGKGYEVLYLRQILEKTIVPDLYKASTDEFGNAVGTQIPVRVTPAGGGAM